MKNHCLSNWGPFVVVALWAPNACLLLHADSHLSSNRLKLFIAPPVTVCLLLHGDSHSWLIFLFFDFPFSPINRNASEAFFSFHASLSRACLKLVRGSRSWPIFLSLTFDYPFPNLFPMHLFRARVPQLSSRIAFLADLLFL